MVTKRTGKPPGRPPKAAQAAPAAAAVEAGRATPEDAAREAGVGKRTVERYQAKARREAGKGAPGARQGAAATPLASEAPSPPAGSQAAARGHAETGADRRASLLALLADALAADPALLDVLPLDAAELGRRLADPGLVGEGDLDELAILGRVQARLEDDLRRLKPEQVVARKGVVGTLVQIAGTAARIRAGRPVETEEPEVLAGRMVEALRDEVLARVLEGVGREEATA